MSLIGNIIEGHLNELLGKGMELSSARLTICRACPIHLDSNIGIICDSSKSINKENQVTEHGAEGSVRGCGCRMSAKATMENQHCVIGKW